MEPSPHQCMPAIGFSPVASSLSTRRPPGTPCSNLPHSPSLAGRPQNGRFQLCKNLRERFVRICGHANVDAARHVLQPKYNRQICRGAGPAGHHATPDLPSPVGADSGDQRGGARSDAWRVQISCADGRRQGLPAGPFKNAPEEQDEKVIITLTDWDESSRTDSASTAATDETEIICTAPDPLPKQQRIFPILRAPIIILIKPDLKRRRDSTDEEDQCIRVAKAERLREDKGLPSIVEVALALQPVCIPKRKSRITLCASSRLKYGC